MDWDNIDKDDVDECRKFFDRERLPYFDVEAVWGKDEIDWSYNASVPFATFDIMEEGRIYCRGIVIDMKDIETLKAGGVL